MFARAGHPAAQATSLGELMDHHWTMPTPRGSYFKQLQERFEQLGREPKVGDRLRNVLILHQLWW